MAGYSPEDPELIRAVEAWVNKKPVGISVAQNHPEGWVTRILGKEAYDWYQTHNFSGKPRHPLVNTLG